VHKRGRKTSIIIIITFAVITETWLRNDDVAWVKSFQFNTDGYKTVTVSRLTRNYGGLALIYKEENTVNSIEWSETVI